MSGVKHTPWTYAWESESSDWVVWGSVSAPDETGMTWQPAICTLSDSQGEDVARLIAAAPDLLTVAIKSHEPYVGLSEEDIRSVYGLEEAKLAIALRDAITRATGDRPEEGGAL